MAGLGHHAACGRSPAGDRIWSRWLSRVVVVALIVAAVATGSSRGAVAQESTGDASVIGGREVEARAFDWSRFRSGSSSGGSATLCDYVAMTAHEFAEYFDEAVRSLVPFGARFYRVSCDSGSSWRYGWWVPSHQASVRGAFEDVIQEAITRLRPLRPLIELSPPVDARHVVGLPTWLAVDPTAWQSRHGVAQAGDVRVEVAVVALTAQWWLGDGGSVRCDGPGALVNPLIGVATQSPPCSYTFTVAPTVDASGMSHWPIGVEIEHRAHASITTPVGTAAVELGTVVGPPAAVLVTVREVQALLQ